jgi:hypothetical protein
MVEAVSEILERVNRERRDRSYPRAVKKARSRYKQRKPDYVGVRHSGPALVVIRAPEPYVLTVPPGLTRRNS